MATLIALILIFTAACTVDQEFMSKEDTEQDYNTKAIVESETFIEHGKSKFAIRFYRINSADTPVLFYVVAPSSLADPGYIVYVQDNSIVFEEGPAKPPVEKPITQ